MSKIIENFTKQDLRDGMICITKDNSRLIKIGNSLRSIKTGNVATLVDKYRPDLSRTQTSDDYLIIMKITFGDEVIFERKETLTERIQSALDDDFEHDIRLFEYDNSGLLGFWNNPADSLAHSSAASLKDFWQFAYDIEGEILFRIAPVVMRGHSTIQPIAAIFYKES